MISPETYSGATGAMGRTAGHPPVFAGKNPVTAEAGAVPANSAAEGLSFLDFVKGLIDIVNPLQHIPVVSTIYRRVTGDEISPVARLAGDALFGGPLGAVASVADLALEKATGKDVGETALAFLKGDKKEETMLAAAPQSAEIEWFTPSPQTQQEFANFIPSSKEEPESRLPLAYAPAQATRPQAALDEPAREGSPSPPPVSAPKGVDRAILATGREETPAQPTKADSAIALRQQDAPVGTGGTSVPPGLTASAPESNKKAATPPGLTAPVPTHLVATKMMEALDKYEAMSRGGLGPARPALYGSF